MTGVIDAIMCPMRPLVALWIACHPLAAWSAEAERDALPRLSIIALLLFSLIMLLSSVPRVLRQVALPDEILRAFAQSRGLVEETVALRQREEPGAAVWRRWRSNNPAVKRPVAGTVVFRGTHAGYPFSIDEVQALTWSGGVRGREAMLRMAIALPDLPATLEVAPAGLLSRFTGRAGLLEPFMGRSRRGRLVATYSDRPVQRAKERIFLTRERRRILEEYEARAGGVHLADGRLFLIRPRFIVTAPVLVDLYDDIGTLARRLAAGG